MDKKMARKGGRGVKLWIITQGIKKEKENTGPFELVETVRSTETPQDVGWHRRVTL